jgi:hypothetical protein
MYSCLGAVECRSTRAAVTHGPAAVTSGAGLCLEHSIEPASAPVRCGLFLAVLVGRAGVPEHHTLAYQGQQALMSIRPACLDCPFRLQSSNCRYR